MLPSKESTHIQISFDDRMLVLPKNELLLSCTFFENLLLGDPGISKYTFLDLDHDTFTTFLNYFYGEESYAITKDTVFPLVMAHKRLQSEDLEESICKWIETECDFGQLVHLHDNTFDIEVTKINQFIKCQLPKFAYGGKSIDITPGNLGDIIAIQERFESTALHKRIIDFIHFYCPTESLFTLLQNIPVGGQVNYVPHLRDMVIKKFKDLNRMNAFDGSSVEFIFGLVKDVECVDQETLLLTINRWIQVDFEDRSVFCLYLIENLKFHEIRYKFLREQVSQNFTLSRIPAFMDFIVNAGFRVDFKPRNRSESWNVYKSGSTTHNKGSFNGTIYSANRKYTSGDGAVYYGNSKLCSPLFQQNRTERR